MFADTRAAGKHDGNDVDAAASKQKRGRFLNQKKFHMPTAYTILFLLLILVAAATWIIPAGSYDYVDGVPVAGTYHTVEQNPQGVGERF